MFYTTSDSTATVTSPVSGASAGGSIIFYTPEALSLNNGEALGEGTSLSVERETPAGTQVKLNVDCGVGAKFYFSFLRSKMKKTHQQAMRSKLNKLSKHLEIAKDTGQVALYEHLQLCVYLIVRELEADTAGYSKWIARKDIDKYKHKVKDVRVKECELQDFPRPIPAKPRKQITRARDLGVFDRIVILYLDYEDKIKSETEEAVQKEENIKSTRERIREKDPIAFGVFNQCPDRLYFITDWVDEYCDLTLDKMIDTLKEDDQEFEVESIPEITDEYIRELKLEIDRREKSLNDTKPSNYREKMKEEELNEIRRELEQKIRAEQETEAQKLVREEKEKFEGEEAHRIARTKGMEKNWLARLGEKARKVFGW